MERLKRIYYIDVVRGIVMIIMALDHVRDLMHTTSLTELPTDMNTTSPALFFTRWITHLCAPTFVFLSGASAFLSMKSKGDISGTRRFLFSRGLWLLLLEFTLINFSLFLDIHFNLFIFEVIAAIGFGFIVLGLLLKLPVTVIGAICLTIIILHNLVPSIPLADTSVVKKVLTPLFVRAAFPLGAGKLLLIGYAPIPWLGIVLVGFASGRFFEWEQKRQRLLFLTIGLSAIALFVLIRFINIYGDSFPWETQRNGLYSFLSFMNVTKYPPSLQFCLLFLGIMFLLLSLLQNVQNKWTDFVRVYGKVPLFYFLVHWYLIHPLVFLMVYLQGFKTSDMVFGSNFGRPKAGSGVRLWLIYLIWIGVVVAMYPLCKWYGSYKQSHKEKKWLRYL